MHAAKCVTYNVNYTAGLDTARHVHIHEHRDFECILQLGLIVLTLLITKLPHPWPFLVLESQVGPRVS